MLDISVDLEHVPEAGDDVEIYNQTMALGGCAYNVSNIMQHFHAEYDLCAPIGKGHYAEIIREMLARTGKNTLISVGQADNGYCMCLIDRDGERTFLTLSGVECQFQPEWFSQIEAEKYDSVYVCGYQMDGQSGEAVADFLEQHPEWTVYYAPGPRICSISENLQKRLYAMHPILHLNEKEALACTGCREVEEAAETLHNMTGNAVIVTLGGRGAYLCEKDRKTLVPSVEQKAVDTTGAGDSHIGTVIAAVSQGRSLVRAVEIANRVAAAVVGVPGAVLTEEEFEKIFPPRENGADISAKAE